MHAMTLSAFGEPEVFQAAEPADPSPKQGEVLVRIAAASVNAIDTKLRRFGGPLAPDFPAVLGCDMSGVVAAIGPGVTSFKSGDRVMGCVGGVRSMPGTYAQYAAVDARLLAPAPKNMSLRDGAALPLAGLTVWLNLIERARLKPGMSVLVNGGAGGVGTIAIQIAKAFGADVTATCRPADAAFVEKLGASATVDYRSDTASKEILELSGGSGYDIVFDAAGLTSLEPLFYAARFNGQVISLIDPGQQNLAPMRARQLTLHVGSLLLWLINDIDRTGAGRMLAEVSRLAEKSRLTPVIDPVPFNLADVSQAHRRLEAREAIGKIIIDVDKAISGSLGHA